MSALYQISPETVVMAEAATKSEVLEVVAMTLSQGHSDLESDEVLESLKEREALGSTGFGRGIAMPHARSNAVTRPHACVVRLDKPIDFEATDAMPVELVIGLVSPVDAGASHLHALAALSRLVRSDEMREMLVSAPDADALYALTTDASTRHAA